jgi:hypothetical protein
VATALGGVLPPADRFDTSKGRVVRNHLWSVGAVPWGPFSNTPTLSLLQADSIVRNSVTSRVSTSLRAVQRAMDAMRVFEREYVDETATAHSGRPFVGTGPRATLPGVARDTSQRLAQQLDDLERQFLHLSSLVTMHRWSTAHTLSGSVLTTARAFEKYVTAELDATKAQLACCHKVYSAPDSAAAGLPQLLVSVLAIAALAVIIYLGLRWRVPSAPATFSNRNTDLLRPALGALANKQRTW